MRSLLEEWKEEVSSGRVTGNTTYVFAKAMDRRDFKRSTNISCWSHMLFSFNINSCTLKNQPRLQSMSVATAAPPAQNGLIYRHVNYKKIMKLERYGQAASPCHQFHYVLSNVADLFIPEWEASCTGFVAKYIKCPSMADYEFAKGNSRNVWISSVRQGYSK